MKLATPLLIGILSLHLLPVPAMRADTFTVVLQGTNGYRVPRIIGASGDISNKGFSGFDYFEWFGITHHRYWFHRRRDESRAADGQYSPDRGISVIRKSEVVTPP